MTGTASGVGLPGSRLTRLLAGLPRVKSEAVDFTLPGVTSEAVEFTLPLVTSEAVDFKLPCVKSEPVDISLPCVESEAVEITLPRVNSGAVDIRLPRVESEAVEITLPRIKSEGVDVTILAPRTEGTILNEQRESAPRRRWTRSKWPIGDLKSRHPVSQLRSIVHLLHPPGYDKSFDIVLPHPLYSFQSQGVSWLLEHSPGALLADDMGLGKTVQAIVAIRLLFRHREITKALVVAPKSVQTSWARHFAEWAPELTVLVIAGSPYKRAAMWRTLTTQRCHVGVVTYDTLSTGC